MGLVSKPMAVALAERPQHETRFFVVMSAEGLEAFLDEHRPTMHEAEKLWVCCRQRLDEAFTGCPHGLLEDAQRLEKCGIFSQTTVVDLARKWHCLSGKWLIFVPPW